MNSRFLVRWSLAVLLVSIVAVSPFIGAQTTAPSAEPAAAPVQIDPKAADLLGQMKSAYAKLASLETSGKVTGNFDVAGQKSQREQQFTGSYIAPNKFRHESKEGIVLGSTGEKLYIFLPAENVYSSIEGSKDKLAHVPQPMENMLFGENPSLLMAISQEPTKVLEGSSVARLDDVVVDARPYAALRATGPSKDEMTLLIDPSTHLLRRMTVDMRKSIAQRGAPDIKSAEFVVDYTSTTPDGAPKPEQFAWAPPQGARDAAASDSAQSAGRSFDAKSMLIGKTAPDFTLKDLAGNDVKLADTKGNVILIDFWATWCPPCIEGMPNLERVHKDRAKEGIKVFAVNAMEEMDKVAMFVKERKLTLPVLLDSDGKVGEAYEVEGWPTSVIVKRDGTVHKVLHPVGPEGEKALEEAINEALKAK